MLKAALVDVTELTVTGAVPVDDRVSDCVAVSLITTFPKVIEVAFTPSFPCPAGDNWIANVADVPAAEAVRVAVCAAVTEETVAVNVAVDALAGTFTVAGTITAALL